jgi:TolB-like protein/class 3 adenylate cyclase/Tfp pilus assembly protein PilF
MAQEGLKRKLTAIFSADVEGYSRLMRDDEEATIQRLTTYRTTMTTMIQQYRGRVVDAPGDNLLAEFGSVVDAVNCAVEIQRELAERNAELPEERRMQFRIGVNLGDVFEEDERIYGDGVNLAARMERLAEAGGICISGTVYDSIVSKLGLEYEYLGEQTVKNIPEPIRSYRVLSLPGVAGHRVIKAKKTVGKTWRNLLLAVAFILVIAGGVVIWNIYLRPSTIPIEAASEERMVYPLPDKPSIAVLPFVNMSQDPKQEYFSDGLTEEIISALSKVPNLFVIARNSTFTYKDKPVNVQQVSEKLGVRYVLEGSVRRTGDKVRITAQLIDAITGRHLWTERYDRELIDIFALQDEITLKIVIAMQVELTEGEQARLKKNPPNLNAYLKTLEVYALLSDFRPENIMRIRRLAEEAVALDPNYAAAHDSLGWSHVMAVMYGLNTGQPHFSLDKAFELGKEALRLDGTLLSAHRLLANVYTFRKMHDKAIMEMKICLRYNPSAAGIQFDLAKFLMNADSPKESIAHYKKAIRLNPYPTVDYFHNFGFAYWMTGQYNEAIEISKKGLKRNPDDMFSHMVLAVSYIETARVEEARASAAEVLRINPKASLYWLEEMLPWRNEAEVDRLISDLRKAGLN